LLIGPFASAPATPTLPAQDENQARNRTLLPSSGGDRRSARGRCSSPASAWRLGPGRRRSGCRLRALGADSHYFLTSGETGVGVSILTDRAIADFAPRAWRIADSYGDAGERLDNPQIDFVPVSDRYIMATRSTAGAERCRLLPQPQPCLLYEVPGAPSRPDDETVPMMFRMFILAMEDQTVCVRSDGDRVHGWHSRFFLPDGRLLPALTNADDLTTIVPAAPVDTLIVVAPASEPAN
jgi:hypothetical protein